MHEVAPQRKQSLPSGKIQIKEALVNALKGEVIKGGSLTISTEKKFIRDSHCDRQGQYIPRMCFEVTPTLEQVVLCKDFDEYI